MPMIADENYIKYLKQIEVDSRAYLDIKAKQALVNFIPIVTAGYVVPYHLMPLINLFERIKNGEQVFAIVSVPPQHGKSETCFHGIPYLMHNFKDRRYNVVYFGYSLDFSIMQSRIIKQKCIASGLIPDKYSNTHKKTTFNNGKHMLLASSIEGISTGIPQELIIIDDPYKDMADVNSKARRKQVIEWFEKSVETRLQPDTSLILIMTRWHIDDLAGWIKKNRDFYEVINLHAIDENNQVLWDYKEDVVRRTKKYSPRTFQTLYQGEPVPESDLLFKNVSYYDEIPEGCRYGFGLDLAYTKKTKSDFSVFTVLAEHNDVYYIEYMERWKLSFPETKQKVLALQNKYPGQYVTEANGPQKAVYDELKNSGVICRAYNPTSDKLTRALPFSEAWNTGRVLLPKPQPDKNQWVHELLGEVLEFTGDSDEHDDIVDSCVMAHHSLKKAKFNIFT